MSDTIMPGPVTENYPIREAACVHTNKIYDSCQSKDCLEELRVFLTSASEELLEAAQSVKGARAELLYTSVQVDPVGFNRGFFTVNLRYFYRITAEVVTAGCCRTSSIAGLAFFDKRAMLFGSQGTAKIFTSQQNCSAHHSSLSFDTNLPTAVVEAVDPIVLGVKLVEVCGTHHHSCCDCALGEIPDAILESFGEPLVLDSNSQKRVLITLGQFSILRMERDSQLLIPVYDYCMPEKECCCDGPVEDDPCTLFQRVDFPVGEFFPPATAEVCDSANQLKNCCE